MRRHAPRVTHFQAGVLALAVLAACLYAVFFPHVPGRHGTEVRAVFATSNELANNSPVRIAGVAVGKVVGVERGPGEAATVTMRIADRGLPIHADATAQIRPRIVLEGNFFVDLQPGTPGTPALRDGGRIPLGQTSVPVQLDQVFSTLDGATRGQLRTLVQEYATALDDGGAEAIRSALREAPGAFSGIAIAARAARGTREHDLGVALRDSGRLTTALASRRAELERLVPAYATTMRALAQADGGLGAVARAAAPLVRDLPGDARRIVGVLPEIERAAVALRPALAQLPAFTSDALPALRQLDRLLGAAEGRGLARDLRPALRSLRRAQPQLRTLLDRVGKVSACTRDVILPTLKATVPDGALTLDQPVWQEIVHLAASLGSASQNFDGNGPSARFHAGYGEGMFSLGDNPTFGELFATQQFSGSRPAWLGPGSDPPFRPQAPCTSEKPPSLEADTLAAPTMRRVSAAPTAAVRRASRRLLRTAAQEARR